MTNNTIPNVPRQLLERLLDYDGAVAIRQNARHELRAILSAPSPAGVDGLEVVSAIAWMNTATKEATTHPVVVMDWDDEKEPVESLMPISQHEAIIDGLRGEVGAQRVKTCAALKARNDAREERDQQAQRIGELEWLLREAAASLAWNAHGECRAIHDGPIMPSQMALDAVKAALGGSL